MIARAYLTKLWSWATDREGFALRVKLPGLRIWTREERSRIDVRVERHVVGTWTEIAVADLTETECGDVRAYHASGGGSADPKVQRVVVHGGTGRIEVFMRDGAP